MNYFCQGFAVLGYDIMILGYYDIGIFLIGKTYYNFIKHLFFSPFRHFLLNS